jgi:dTDP-4-amino-4,6-dideoxygalactose transaminase
MISIYELRLKYLFGRGLDVDRNAFSNFLLFDSGRSALFFLQTFLMEQAGIKDVYVNLYTTDVVHKTLRQAGCTIHPIDVDPLTFFPRLTDDSDFTRSVFLQTGLFGFPSFDQGVFQRVKQGGGLFVEDSCNSFGSRIGQKEAGSVGGASVFSFRVGKALSTGGGALRVNDDYLRDGLYQRFSRVPSFSIPQARARISRAYLDYLAFEPWVLQHVSRPLRRMQKNNAFLLRFAKGGVVDTLTVVNADSIRRMSEHESNFALRRLAQFESEVRKKREVSDCLRDKLAKYPLYIYANDSHMRGGWNYLFFPILLRKGDPTTFLDHLRQYGFDASRFHHEVPQSSFPNISRDQFPGTYTLVDDLVCIPNTTRMTGRTEDLENAIGKYFARFAD